jgi:hypothetical protein
MIGEKIEEVIKQAVLKALSESKGKDIPEPADLIETDNLGEIIEKLAILHCRMWHLEDAMMENYDNDKILADLKRKTDICFKQKRPMYVQAINRMIDNAITGGRSVVSDSVKLYKGFE